MKIAVLSDTHDNIWKLERALLQMGEASLLIHCGDLCSPFVVNRIGEFSDGRPVHIVWGNNEGDIRLICQVVSEYPNIQLHGAFAEIEVEGIKIAVNHYPEIARLLATSGQYQLVCYGHDHTAHTEVKDDCIILNPGELMGLYGKTTFAFFDILTRKVEFIDVK